MLYLVCLLLLNLVIPLKGQYRQPPIICDCGFKDESGNLWSSVWYSNYQKNDSVHLQHDKNFMLMDYSVGRNKQGSNYERIFNKNNVDLTPDGAKLYVRTDQNGKPTSASFGTFRNDILYGTFRSYLKTPSIPGTVSAFYYYESDASEIDMETLSKYDNPRQTFFAIQPQIYNQDGSASNLTHHKEFLDYNPTTDYHMYRFDWLPEKVDFFLDNEYKNTMTTRIPYKPGRIIMNHWSDGNPNFSGQPPSNQEIELSVANLTFFFNSSQENFNPPCKATTQACSVSDIMSRKIVPGSELPPSLTGGSTSIHSSSLTSLIPIIIFITFFF